MAGDRKLHLLYRLWLRLLAATGIILAVMLSWWLKIDDARAPDLLPAAAFGQPLDMGRVRLTPRALELRRTDGQGDRIILTALIENVTGESQVAIFGGPPHPPALLVAGTQLEPPEVMLVRDNEPLRQLEPRLPEEVELVWPLAAGWRPEAVTLEFSRQIFKLRDNLYGKSSWLGFTPAYRMTATPEVRQ